ncbi:hypothetical protein, partial [uncultured Megasphaera sp.]|uniref:hypothetical protein n=1 Tax=uncultured Megasphaera sp. TaxID=165188 RepID=UPI002593AB5D
MAIAALKNGEVKSNTEAITALKNGEVKSNTEAITALKNGEVKRNTDAITALKNGEVKSNTTAINNLSVTVAENKKATDGSLKKLEDAFNKRISGQNAGQVHLGIDTKENGQLGMRYFRTSMSKDGDAHPDGTDSLAIGNSTTKGSGAIGIAAGGENFAAIEGKDSIGIGNKVQITADTKNENVIAVGTEASVLDQAAGAIAIGYQTSIAATNENAMAIGTGAKTYAEDTMALGHSAQSNMKGSIAIGAGAQVGEYLEPPVLNADGGKQDGLGSGINGIAIGNGAQSMSDATIAIGVNAGAGMKKTGNIPLAASHIIIGDQAGEGLEGLQNIALGYKSGGNVQSNYNVSIGSEAGRNILGSRTDPIGKNVSIGYHANFRKAVTQPEQDVEDTEGDPGTTTPPKEKMMKIPRIAEDSEKIRLVQSTAIGSESIAANDGTAIGYQAQALGHSGTAIGFTAIAKGENTVALGADAKAEAGNVAIGSGSVAPEQIVTGKTAEYTGAKASTTVVSVGNQTGHMLRRVTNVGDAIDAQDAVTLAQLKAGLAQVAKDINVKAQGPHAASGVGYDLGAIGGMPSITLQPGDQKTGTIIHNVAKGVNAGDAVNLAQLKEYTEQGMGHYFSTNAPVAKSNFDNGGATGENAVAFGIAAASTAKYSAAMGNYVQAQGEGSLAIGTGYYDKEDPATKPATGEEVQPIVTKAVSGYRYNAAIGAGAITEGNYSMAVGPRAMVRHKLDKQSGESLSPDYSLAMGYLATVYDRNGIAIGNSAEAHQQDGIAVGRDSWSLRDDAVVMGTHNTAVGKQSAAVGYQNGVSGMNTYVIGSSNMNLTDEDRKDVLDTLAYAATKGITDDNSTVLGNNNTFDPFFEVKKSLDQKTDVNIIKRGEDNHLVGNQNAINMYNTHAFVVGSSNTLTKTNNTGVLGSGNTVTVDNTITLGNTNEAGGADTKILGHENTITAESAAIIGDKNRKISGDQIHILGSSNENISSTKGHIIGFANTEIAGTRHRIIGDENRQVSGQHTVLLGDANVNIDAANTQIFGDENTGVSTVRSHIIGSLNSSISGTGQQIIGDENKNIAGNRNVILGNKNNTVGTDTEGTQIFGDENTEVSATKSHIIGSLNSSIAGTEQRIIGDENKNIAGNRNVVLGNKNKNIAANTENTQVSGNENADIAAVRSLVWGYQNQQVATGTADTQIIGNRNSNIKAERTQIIGDSNAAGSVETNMTTGASGEPIAQSTLTAITDSQIMGNANKVQHSHVQVLGNRISTGLGNSAYIGDDAAYTDDAALSAGNTEYTKDAIYGYTFAAAKPTGVVTVGAKDKERRIQNVAAGLVAPTATDAVNGSQLYQLTRPLHFGGDNSVFAEHEDHAKDKNVLHTGSNQILTIKGGADLSKVSAGNIGVVVDAEQKTMNVKLAKNLTDLESVTFGNDDTAMKLDGTTRSISQVKKVTFGAPDAKNSVVIDGTKNVLTGLSNTEWLPPAKRGADFDKSQAATQGQLEAFEKTTQRGFDVYVNTEDKADTFSVTLGDEKKNDAIGFLAGNNLTVTHKDKQITYALKDDLSVGRKTENGEPGKDGSIGVQGKNGESVVINGKDGTVTMESAKDEHNNKNTISLNGKDGTVGITGKDGTGVVMNGENGTIAVQGKDGEDGKAGAAVVIDGKNGITTIAGKTDENNKKNMITLNGKDGSMGVSGKDGNHVTLNGNDGSIAIKGNDGTDTVFVTTQNGTVGVDGQDGTTRLVVKDGDKTNALATVKDGLKFMGDAGTENKLSLNEQLTITGGIAASEALSTENNLGVVADGKHNLTVRLAKDLKGLDSISLGDKEAPMKIDGTKKTISRIQTMIFGAPDSTDRLTLHGDDKVITGLSNTELKKDMKADQAASQGQLTQVLEKLDQAKKDATDYQLVGNPEDTTNHKYTVSDAGEVTLTVQDKKHPTNTEKVTIADVAKKSDVTKLDKTFADYAVKYDKNGDVVNKDSITLAGNTTTGTAIHNVAKGDVSENSKDAVNGGQLFATQQTMESKITNVTNNLSKTNQGFDVYINDQNNADNTFTVKLGEDKKDAFGFAAGNGLEISKTGKKITYALKDEVEVGKQGTGKDGKDGKVTVHGKDGESVVINGKDGTIVANGKDGAAVTINGADGSI